MGEQNSSQHDDNAEALRSLADLSAASEEQQDQPEEKPPSEALAEMAEGQDLAPPDQQDAQQNHAAGDAPEDLAQLAGSEGPPAVQAGDLQGLPNAAQTMASRRARAAAFERQNRRAQADQFKRLMVPLLLAVGLLLIVLGGVAVALLPSGKSSSLGASAKWAVAAAFPLGALLLFAAWFYHRQLKGPQK
ncbi:MAG: hypothetical protein ACYTF6_09110 [Planctomycetota bacterium]|jgi:hypothetical protein